MQYSLRTLMIVITCVAVACFVFFVLPAQFSRLLLGCCFMLASTAVLSLLVYGEGAWRAFAVGSVLPLVWCWMALGTQGMLGVDPGFFFVMAIIIVASGFVSVGVRRRVKVNGRIRKSKSGMVVDDNGDARTKSQPDSARREE